MTKTLTDTDYVVVNSKGSKVLKDVLLTVVSIAAIITIVSSIIVFRYRNEISNFSLDPYNQLEETAKNVLKEGSGVDLEALPSNVKDYSLINHNGNIELSFSLINDNDFLYAPSQSMSISLTKDYKIIEKKNSYPSNRKEYKRKIKFNIVAASAGYTIIGVLLLSCFMELVFTVLSVLFSHKKKNNNNSNDNKYIHL